jgi:hypothetical protein
MTSNSGNSQKTPLARSLEQFANRKVHSALNLLGRSLPCSVASVISSGTVSVNFELTNVGFTLPKITVPVMAFEYVRYPIQVGCKGMVISADAYLGGVSGLGGGTADLTVRPNLANLAFVPLGNTAWSAADDPNAVVIYGPDGAIIRTAARDSILTVGTGVITIQAASIVFDGPVTFNNSVTGAGNTINFGSSTIEAGAITSNGVDVGSTHTHSEVQPGSGNTGPPS